MTVEEYELAVEDAIETRNLRIWEVYDLRLLVKFARRRNRVLAFDELFLEFAGRVHHGPVLLPTKRLALSEPYTPATQKNLF